jgi:ssDNA-binding Zn-finger/Zn-ribbon topoisomerase 1
MTDKEEVSITIACPLCGAELQVKTNRETGHEFLGCPRYFERDLNGNRRCEYTRELPDHIRMQRAGAMSLPGF